MRGTLALVVALSLVGCAKKLPPGEPPSPPVDLTLHNATRAVITDTVPESEEAGSLGTLVLPDATDVVVVHVRRMIELELNPLMLLLARKYVADDCLLSSVLEVEKVTISNGPSGWIAAAEGDDLSKTVLECLGKEAEQTFAGRPSAVLMDDLRGVDRDGALVVGKEGPLRRMFGMRSTKDSARSAIDMLPNRDDTLIEVGSRSAIKGAPSLSSGFVSGDLDALRLHSESTVQDGELARIAKMFPILKMAIRPALEKMLGEGPQTDTLVALLDKLELEQEGDKIIVDLVVDDPMGLIRTLTAGRDEAKKKSATRRTTK